MITLLRAVRNTQTSFSGMRLIAGVPTPVTLNFAYRLRDASVTRKSTNNDRVGSYSLPDITNTAPQPGDWVTIDTQTFIVGQLYSQFKRSGLYKIDFDLLHASLVISIYGSVRTQVDYQDRIVVGPLLHANVPSSFRPRLEDLGAANTRLELDALIPEGFGVSIGDLLVSPDYRLTVTGVQEGFSGALRYLARQEMH